MKLFGLTMVWIVLAAPGALAQLAKQKEFRVKVEIAKSEKADSSLDGRVLSYFSRELRELRGVVLVENDPQYVISVFPLELGGNRFAISTELLRPLSDSDLLMFYAEILSADSTPQVLFDQEAMKKAMKTTGLTRVFSIMAREIATTSNIQKYAADFVASFDGQELEPERKRWQEIRRKYESLMKKAPN